MKVPGPGTYTVAKIKEGPEFVMGTKLSKPKPQPGPAPSTYNPSDDFVKKKLPVFTLGKKTEYLDNLRKNPGPGAYDANPAPKCKQAPSYGFGTGKQRESLSPEHKKIVPGPGNYKVPSYIGNRETTQLQFRFV